MMGVAVSDDACGEAVETGQVVLADGVEPPARVLALALREHLGEELHVTGERIGLGTLGQHGFEPHADVRAR